MKLKMPPNLQIGSLGLETLYSLAVIELFVCFHSLLLPTNSYWYVVLLLLPPLEYKFFSRFFTFLRKKESLACRKITIKSNQETLRFNTWKLNLWWKTIWSKLKLTENYVQSVWIELPTPIPFVSLSDIYHNSCQDWNTTTHISFITVSLLNDNNLMLITFT